MILEQYATDIIQDADGGRMGDVFNLLPNDIYDKIHQSRAKVICADFKARKVIRPQWLQTVILSYDSTLQDNPSVYVRFAIPAAPVESRLSKIITYDTTQSISVCDRFQLAMYMRNDWQKPRPNRMLAVVESGYVEIYGNTMIGQNPVKPLKMYAVFHDPTLVPFLLADNTTRKFQPDGDMYPLDEDNATQVRKNVLELLIPNIGMKTNPTDIQDDGSPRIKE